MIGLKRSLCCTTQEVRMTWMMRGGGVYFLRIFGLVSVGVSAGVCKYKVLLTYDSVKMGFRQNILKWTNEIEGSETAIASSCLHFGGHLLFTCGRNFGGNLRLILIRFSAQAEKWREKATRSDPILCSRRKLAGNYGSFWSVFKLKN